MAVLRSRVTVCVLAVVFFSACVSAEEAGKSNSPGDQVEVALLKRDVQLKTSEASAAEIAKEVAIKEKDLLKSRLDNVDKELKEALEKLAKVTQDKVNAEETLTKDLKQVKADLEEKTKKVGDNWQLAMNPKFSTWVGSNAKSVGTLISGDWQSGKSFGDAVGGTIDSAALLEERLEKKSSVFFARFMSLLIVCAPMYLLAKFSSCLANSLRLEQHVFVGYVFNALVLMGALAVMLLTRKDPLVTAWASPVMRILFIIFFSAQVAVITASLGFLSVVEARNRLKSMPKFSKKGTLNALFMSVGDGYLSQLVFYCVLVWHAKVKTAPRLRMSTEWTPVSANAWVYCFYLVGSILLAISNSEDWLNDDEAFSKRVRGGIHFFSVRSRGLLQVVDMALVPLRAVFYRVGNMLTNKKRTAFGGKYKDFESDPLPLTPHAYVKADTGSPVTPRYSSSSLLP